MKRFILWSFAVFVNAVVANAQVTIEINSKPLHYQYYDVAVKSMELTERATIVYKMVQPKTDGIYVYSDRDESIVDALTGRSYNIMESSIGFEPEKSIHTGMNPCALVEIYPPLPSNVTSINITSDGKTCYAKGVNISSKRRPLQTEMNSGLNEFNLGQNLAASKQWDATFEHYKKAALTTGLALAQIEVALGYERGEGTTVNFPDAFYWMYKAGTNELPADNAYIYLGIYYKEGTGTFVNYEKSLKYFKLGSQKCTFQDFRDECAFYVALAYQLGMGVNVDLPEACRWYRTAASNGHPVASLNLGNRYANGEGVNQDFKEAEKWWTVSAKNGNVQGMMNLGQLYRDGYEGVKKNKKQAIYWYQQAANNGETKALIEIQKLNN